MRVCVHACEHVCMAVHAYLFLHMYVPACVHMCDHVYACIGCMCPHVCSRVNSDDDRSASWEGEKVEGGKGIVLDGFHMVSYLVLILTFTLQHGCYRTHSTGGISELSPNPN